MYRLIHIESGFEFSFVTLEEAIEYLETYDNQEEFEIRRQTARSIFLFKKNEHMFATDPDRSGAGNARARVWGRKNFKKV